jgi:hypothetical protein
MRQRTLPRLATGAGGVLQLVLVAGLALTAAACGAKRANVTVTPEMQALAGSWRFNAAESDDSATIAERMREARSDGPRGSYGGGGGGFEGGGGGMGRGHRRGGEREGGYGGGEGGERSGRGPGAMLRAPQQLTIAVGDTTVTFDQHDGFRRMVPMDRRTVKEEMGSSATIKIKAHWEGQHFIVEREMDRGMKVREEYFVEPHAHQLHEVVELTPGEMGGKVTFLRVYDAG